MIALYEDTRMYKFMGILTENVDKFGGSSVENDKASSLWAIKGNWELFDRDNYDVKSGEKSLKICEGQTITNIGKEFNDKITSARVMVESCKIIDM